MPGGIICKALYTGDTGNGNFIRGMEILAFHSPCGGAIIYSGLVMCENLCL